MNRQRLFSLIFAILMLILGFFVLLYTARKSHDTSQSFRAPQQTERIAS